MIIFQQAKITYIFFIMRSHQILRQKFWEQRAYLGHKVNSDTWEGEKPAIIAFMDMNAEANGT